jgi:tetratricopeptide (TPR) repeat protein
MGEYSKALSSHEKALEIQQKTLPPTHPHWAMSYNNIGLVYAKMGEYSKARPFFERAVDIGQQSLPKDHPLFQGWRKNLDLVKKNL